MTSAAFLLSLMAVSLLPFEAFPQEPLIELKEYVFTNGVYEKGEKKRQFKKKYFDEAPRMKPFYFWMRVAGKEEALKELRKAGKLPIKHLWLLVVGRRYLSPGKAAAQVNEFRIIDSIPLDASKRERLRELGVELEKRHFFDWRTWSFKNRIYPGLWAVRIVYADGKPILCGNNKHCEFIIKIK